MSRPRWLRVLPALLTLGFVVAAAPPSQADDRVRAFDDCDPASFNATIGPGTCIGSGHTTFNQFVNELQTRHSVAAWKFGPTMLSVPSGSSVRLDNHGGETHTFTVVQQFGGGFVDFLNQLSGHPNPAPECASRDGDGNLVPRGPNASSAFVDADRRTSMRTGSGAPLHSGTNLMQCCIHPWMQTQIAVMPGKDD